jgi:hypothetical protein
MGKLRDLLLLFHLLIGFFYRLGNIGMGWSSISPSVRNQLFQAIERTSKDLIPVNLTHIAFGYDEIS